MRHGIARGTGGDGGGRMVGGRARVDARPQGARSASPSAAEAMKTVADDVARHMVAGDVAPEEATERGARPSVAVSREGQPARPVGPPRAGSPSKTKVSITV